MKNNALTIIIIFFIFSLFFVSCSTTANPITSATKAQPQAEPQALPQEPDLTEAPPPLPCTITFDSDRDGNWEIYRMAPDGSDTVNLSNNLGDDFDPAWSPDGSQIAFVSNRENGQEGGQFIYVMNADGSNVRQLTFENGSNWPDWSHDGSRITYTSNDDVFVINADGSGQSINITNNPEKDAQSTWSPDGKKIAWISNRTIFVMDADGSNIRQLTKEGTSDGVEWTVDGQIFTGMDNITGMDNKTSSCHNCVMDADGKNIISGGGKGEVQKYLPFWTLDGHRVEVANVDIFTGDNEIYLVSEIYPDIFLNLTNNPADDRNPDWPANCTLNREPLPAATQASSTLTAPPSPQEMIFGYVDSQNKMPEQKEAELLKACDELKIKCIKSDSITKLVGQKVNAILTYSDKWKVLGAYPEIEEATTKGILVIVLDAETGAHGAYNLSIESDSVRSSLKWMFNEMGGMGEFAYFNFNQNPTNQSIIDQVLKEYPEIKAKSMPANFEGNSITEEKIAALATTNPNLGAIWTDQWVTDVFWGLKNGQVKLIPVILCEPSKDYLQFWKGWTDYDPTFKCFSTIKPGGTAYEGVYVAYYILSGEEIDPAALGGNDGNTFIYNYPKITNENLDEWLEKIDSFRKGERDILELPPMTPDEIKEKWFLE